MVQQLYMVLRVLCVYGLTERKQKGNGKESLPEKTRAHLSEGFFSNKVWNDVIKTRRNYQFTEFKKMGAFSPTVVHTSVGRIKIRQHLLY